MGLFFFAGSVVALAAAIVYLVIGIVAAVKATKANALHMYVFFGISTLILALFLLEWHFAFGRGGEQAPAVGAQPSQNLWPLWLSGIGTTSLAIMTFVMSVVVPRWNRPKLEVDFKDGPIYLRERTDPPSESFWLRVRVKNTGGSVAKSCTGRVTRFMDSLGHPIDYDPLTLHWIEVPWEYDPFRPVDLRQREERYMDILVQKAGDTTNLFLFAQPFRDRYGTLKLVELPVGTSGIEIVVYGENARPSHPQKYQITSNPVNPYKSIRLKKS